MQGLRFMVQGAGFRMRVRTVGQGIGQGRGINDASDVPEIRMPGWQGGRVLRVAGWHRVAGWQGGQGGQGDILVLSLSNFSH